MSSLRNPNSCITSRHDDEKVIFQKYRQKLQAADVLYVNVKVIPKASKTEFVEVMVGPDGEDILKIRVAAVPEKGRANEELCRYLGKCLGVPKGQVKVSAGQSSRQKLIKVSQSR
ncbi:MAG: DUF167 domain-containing protein [bacterium]|nr:DUF167 domain-containing protein [bacterium]